MSNNFHKTDVLKKYRLQTKATKQKIVLKNFGGVPVLKLLQRLALDFPIYLSVIFPRLPYRQMYGKFQKVVLGFLLHVTRSIFFRAILRSEALVCISYFFQNSRSTEII